MDFLWIFLVIVLLFGANKLPQLAKGLGKSLGEFKKAKEEFEREVNSAASEPDAKAGDKAPHISGNLPGPVTPAPTASATSTDELTKKS